MESLSGSTPTTELWDTARKKVIACATVIEEMLPYLPADIPYEKLEFGLHLHPMVLKETLQAKIEASSAEADVLLLGYGLCSMAAVGLRATSATLVIPRVDDCISIFLGSFKAYLDQQHAEPGTFYLTKGWIEVGDNPIKDIEMFEKKYGPVTALRMMKLQLRNYKRVAFINTGMYQIEHYRQQVREMSETYGLRMEEIEGSPRLVKKLIFGPWDAEDFVVVPPGGTIRFEDFVHKGESAT
jgi:hypothetical protein